MSLSGNEPGGQTTTASVGRYAGPVADNIYISDVAGNAALDDTPYIADLVGGAEIYGLLNGVTKSSLSTYLGTIHDNDLAAVIRLEKGIGLYSDDYSGMDMLLFVNLTNDYLSLPQLGISLSGSTTPPCASR